ncbi:tetratricopeptide repeat protein [Lichenibacterium dinghuense]|uniref:tetratricopeptide repeat protein n=1 Tax=Lichenibacterium dinghuense TaxID=2895977 RepID=UPI001F16623A|nr:tetratricopeptide repeat protein [Lichenibacterium sp. 6Y81]
MNRAERRRDARRARSAGAGRAGGPAFARAVALFGAGDLDGAERLFTRLRDAGLDAARARHNLGVIAARRGRYPEAVDLFRSALAIRPDDPEAWTQLALAFAESGTLAEARMAAERAVTLAPDAPAALAALAEVCLCTDDLAGALEASERALAVDPAFAPALMRRAAALRRLGRSRDAEADLRVVMAAEGIGGSACLALSALLAEDERPDEAAALLDRAIAERPDHALARMNRAVFHQRAGRFDEALADFRRTLELAPDDPRAYHNVGYMLQRIEQPRAAIPFLEHAIRLKPDLVESFIFLAECYRDLADYGTAAPVLEHAAAIAPDRPWLRMALLWARMHACDWRALGTTLADDLALCVERGNTFSPFIVMALGLSNAETLLWTRAWTEANLTVAPAPLRHPEREGPRTRIRVGYLSADFRGHATAVLLMDLFEQHDRGRFETFGYNIGRGDGSVMGERMTGALEHFVDVSFLGDRDAAQRIADDALDLLVDLKGFTTDSRPNILSFRPAPVQVNYLGFPGTMGTPHVDYVVVDETVAPFEHQPFYDERIVHLPHSYQPNDRQRSGADPGARRADHGLPERGFVFCCFNNTYKITPLVFDIWMRLLGTVEGSVLWLFEANPQAGDNLRREAAARGIDPNRLVFAPRAGFGDHLGRLGLADLFLDTLPVNAHTTASDALWAGVPVLTMLGPLFAGRVAASLNRAVGLPELVTESFADYEAEALALARDSGRLGALRARLAANRASAPLWDTPRYTRDYEAALERMVAIHDAGGAPEAFAVSAEGMSP